VIKPEIPLGMTYPVYNSRSVRPPPFSGQERPYAKKRCAPSKKGNALPSKTRARSGPDECFSSFSSPARCRVAFLSSVTVSPASGASLCRIPLRQHAILSTGQMERWRTPFLLMRTRKPLRTNYQPCALIVIPSQNDFPSLPALRKNPLFFSGWDGA